MPQQKPLDVHQQELVNIVKAAHQTLAIARKLRTTELARRIAEEKIRIEREFEENQVRIKMDLDAEVAVHESNLDESLITAYNNGVPIRRIALDGFGNRYDGGVQQLLVKIRSDARLGNREGWQRNTVPADEVESTVAFPKAINVADILTEATTVDGPTFTLLSAPLVLLEADEKHDTPEVAVTQVRLDVDPRDPYFRSIAKTMRPGSPNQYATSATLYVHPATGALTAYESREDSTLYWDHPVARWAKDHPEEALTGFRAAMLASLPVSVDDLEKVRALGEQLGLRPADAEPSE